jgi:hypothetical protein
MKKFFKILGMFLLAVVALIVVAPFFLQNQIAEIVKSKLNASVHAQINFTDVDLSLFRAFPDAQLNLQGFSIINKAPFAGDTLFYAKEVKLDLPVRDLFNDVNEPIRVNEIIIDQAVVNLKSDLDGKANWDIAKTDSDTAETESSKFNVDLKNYEIINSTFSYEDEVTKNILKFTELNHRGKGDLSQVKSTLETYSEAKVAYSVSGIEYLSGQLVKLDAALAIDLANSKYSFLDNKAFINDLELKLDGFVDLEHDGTMVDLTMSTPSSDFKNFFAMIPATYRKNVDGMTTAGDFTVKGTIKGLVTDTTIPNLDIKMSSKNASFKYADLPQEVTDIIIDVFIKNDTGIAEDTYINVANIAFNLAGDRLAGRAMVTDLTRNMKVDMNAKGDLDFKNLAKSFPMPADINLSGKMGLDMNAKFEMESVEKERYENVYMNGTASITNFIYNGSAFNNAFVIDQAAVDMTASTIKLNSFKAKTGITDLNATGTINNLVGFLLQDKRLKGAFKVISNTLDSSDFMADVAPVAATNSNKKTAAASESIKIPAFLDASLDFAINKVLYDGITLTNVKGLATIKDEKMALTNTSTNVFGGNIGLNGFVDTKNAQPVFDMALTMKDLDIAQSFNGFEMFQKLVPIISALQGKMTADIKLSGTLNGDFTPVLSSIAGDAFAQLLTREVNTSSPLMAELDNKLSFISLSDIDISNITTKLKFKDGAVQVSPFDFKVRDMNVTASGTHSLTNDMNYTLAFKVPAKYLGKEGAALMSKLNEQEIGTLSVPVPVQIGGSMAKPTVNLNLKSAIMNLTNQIIELQKAKFQAKGQDAINSAINDALGGKKPLSGIKDILQGNKGTTAGSETRGKPIDSVAIKRAKDSLIQATKKKAADETKKAAGNAINNLFKKKN